MISYRAKNILRGIIGKRGEKKRARIFSVLAIFAITILISSISVYGFNLRGGAEGTNISATGTINNNYNYNYQGVSIHTKAETIDPATGLPRGDATVRKGGTGTPATLDVVRFTLTVSNADSATKPVDVKFTLPTGFTFNAMVASPPGLPPTPAPVDGVITWTAYPAPSGDTTIVFNTNGPA